MNSNSRFNTTPLLWFDIFFSQYFFLKEFFVLELLLLIGVCLQCESGASACGVGAVGIGATTASYQQLGDQSQTTASSTAENTAHTAVEMSSFESPLPPIQVLTLTPAPAASVVKKSDKTSSPFKPLGTQGKASATPVKRRLLELSNTLQSTEQQILLNSARRSRAISSEHVAVLQKLSVFRS
jgi:hypothetical protein